jgi:hypothetical protein
MSKLNGVGGGAINATCRPLYPGSVPIPIAEAGCAQDRPGPAQQFRPPVGVKPSTVQLIKSRYSGYALPAEITYTVQRLATDWAVRESNPGRGEIFRNCQGPPGPTQPPVQWVPGLSTSGPSRPVIG